MLGAIWTHENKPELIDLPFAESTTEKTSSAPTQAEYEEFFEGEEDVTESEPKGKYEGICSQQLSDMVCDGSDLSPFRCEYGKCPLVVKVNGKTLTCTPFMEQYPEAFRRVAIDYLEGLEGKA